MFTGIIQDIGSIKFIDIGLYEISTNLDLADCSEGSSISCNGVCLTAKNIKRDNNKFTLRTNLGENINNSSKINLEKSLRIGDEIGGHFVYGHIDTTTKVVKITKLANSWEYHFSKNFNKNNKFVIEKASISINGISLTIANVSDKSFMISIIDHTFKNTNLKFLEENDAVNIEFDYLARFTDHE